MYVAIFFCAFAGITKLWLGVVSIRKYKDEVRNVFKQLC